MDGVEEAIRDRTAKPSLKRKECLSHDTPQEDDEGEHDALVQDAAHLESSHDSQPRPKSRSQLLAQNMAANSKARSALVEARVRKMQMDSARQDRELEEANAERKLQREREAARDRHEMR